MMIMIMVIMISMSKTCEHTYDEVEEVLLKNTYDKHVNIYMMNMSNTGEHTYVELVIIINACHLHHQSENVADITSNISWVFLIV